MTTRDRDVGDKNAAAATAAHDLARPEDRAC